MVMRTVGVKLTAEASGYLATIGKATLMTQQFASKSQAAIAKHSDNINKLSNTAGLLGAGMLAGVGFVVKSAAQFDKAMSAVSATGNDARLNIDGLRKAAIDMGASTAFSATEAAKGIENMLKAGVSAKDVMGGGLKGALDLAAAGNLEVGDAAEIAATAMAQFNLTGKDVPHIADLLAAGAGKAQGEVADMGMALKQSGLVASQFGLSLEDTTGTLAAFANKGLIGSDAGTSFKTMLLSLASPSSKAKELMDDLGISAYDAQGKFVGITNLAEQLHVKLNGLTQAERDAALATIFGTDAIRAANVLYDQGGEKIQGWIDKTNDAGYAAKVARERLNNLSGDVEQLRGAFESAFIKGGSGPNEALRGLTQSATAATRAFGNLPAPVLETGVKLTALAGIGLLGVAGLGKLATSAVSLGGAFSALSEKSPKTARGLQTVGKAAGIATAAVVGLQLVAGSSSKFKFVADVDAAADALLRLGSSRVNLNNVFTLDKGVVDNINGFEDALKRVASPHWYDRIGSFLDGVAGTTASATNQMKANFEAVDKAIASLSPEDAQRAFGDMAAQAANAKVPVGDLVKLFPQYSNQVRDAANASGHTIKSTEELADIMAHGLPGAAIESASALARTANKTGEVTEESKAAKKQLADLTEKMFETSRAALELEGSEDGVQAAMDDATKAAKENGKTADKNGKQLQNNTQKGRENRAALRNLALASIAYREKLIEQGASQKKVTSTSEEARKKFIATAEKMGLSTKAAKALADKFGLVDQKINGLNNKTVKTKVTFSVSGDGFKIHIPESTIKLRQGYAAGGEVQGPGTGTSDSILGINTSGVPTARVSRGEFVVNAKSTKKYRPLIDDINADRLAGGGFVDEQIWSNRFPDPREAGRKIQGIGARSISNRVGNALGKSTDLAQVGGLPAGGAPSGRGMGALFKYASGLGMGHGTYPGHGEKGMNKAWDFSPVGGGRGNRLAGHAWAHAKNYGIWYVIWNRRIASRTRPGAGWRPYTRYGANASPSQAHTNHVHVSWYGQGTDKARRGLAVVGENGPELVNMRGGEQVRPVNDYRFAGGGMGGTGGGGTVVIENHYHFDRYIGNRNELIREMNTLNRQNRMAVILR